MPAPISSSGTITIGNKAGSTIVIDTQNHNVSFNDAGGATASYNLATNTWTGTVPVGPFSYSLNSQGAGTMSFSTGAVSAGISFNTQSGYVNSANLNYGSTYAGANISLTHNVSTGAWTGLAGAGFRVPDWVPGSTSINGLTYKSVTFNPVVSDPCTLMGTGFAAQTCATLSNSAVYGTINTNEQKLLNEASSFNSTPTSGYNNIVDDATFYYDAGMKERYSSNEMFSFDSAAYYGYTDYGTYY